MNHYVVSHPPERALGDRAPNMSEAHAVIAFWREAGPDLWFAKNPEFDERFRARFLDLHQASAEGALNAWLESPEGALALVLLLLDQFPRNAFRGDARMYATDDTARTVAGEAIDRGHDRMTAIDLRIFFYLPFAHSENLRDQDRAVALAAAAGEESRRHAEHHRDIILRFGCFPHRNAILDRPGTPDQDAYLANGGFAG
jgi:uncharacterized protein (DUF924 family)